MRPLALCAVHPEDRDSSTAGWGGHIREGCPAECPETSMPQTSWWSLMSAGTQPAVTRLRAGPCDGERGWDLSVNPCRAEGSAEGSEGTWMLKGVEEARLGKAGLPVWAESPPQRPAGGQAGKKSTRGEAAVPAPAVLPVWGAGWGLRVPKIGLAGPPLTPAAHPLQLSVEKMEGPVCGGPGLSAQRQRCPGELVSARLRTPHSWGRATSLLVFLLPTPPSPSAVFFLLPSSPHSRPMCSCWPARSPAVCAMWRQQTSTGEHRSSLGAGGLGRRAFPNGHTMWSPAHGGIWVIHPGSLCGGPASGRGSHIQSEKGAHLLCTNISGAPCAPGAAVQHREGLGSGLSHFTNVLRECGPSPSLSGPQPPDGHLSRSRGSVKMSDDSGRGLGAPCLGAVCPSLSPHSSSRHQGDQLEVQAGPGGHAPGADQ